MSNGRTVAAAAWSALILGLCWLPRHWLVAIESQRAGGFALGELNLDKAVHLAFFVGFGWLWMRALEDRIGPIGRRAGSVLIGGLAFAALSELGQAIPVLGRTAHLVDFLCDAAGVVLGIAIAWRPLPSTR